MADGKAGAAAGGDKPKKASFRHESLEDRRSIARYLEALQSGFRDGSLVFEGRDGELALTPDGLLRFEVQASTKRDERRLTLKVAWKESPAASGPGSLGIRTGED